VVQSFQDTETIDILESVTRGVCGSIIIDTGALALCIGSAAQRWHETLGFLPNSA